MDKYLLKRFDNNQQWDEFVEHSPQGSIFCQSSFLKALNVSYDLWLIEEKGQPQAGAIILRNENEVIIAPHSYAMYQGILFAEKSGAFPPHSKSKWKLEVFDELLAGLSEQYNRLSFCLHYAHEDLRGLQWFHYHEPHLGKFKFELNYTGLVDLAAYFEFEAYLASIRPTRRYEYRQALSKNLTLEVSSDIDTFYRLYELTFLRQGITLNEQENSLAHSIVATALSNGFGELLICREESGQAIASTLFLYDNVCGYYMFGANHPDYNKLNGGTFLMVENIRRCMERGLKFVDMVGVNSPNSGDFKASFNAVPVPYFVVTWERVV